MRRIILSVACQALQQFSTLSDRHDFSLKKLWYTTSVFPFHYNCCLKDFSI